MTYVVGWSPFHRDAGAIELACSLARSAGEDLHVVSVAPSGWGGHGRTEAANSGDMERALGEAQAHMDAAGVSGKVVSSTSRSVPQALLEAVKSTNADLLVLGSGTDAATGRIGLSSKTNRLVHSSPIAVALAPRGYRVEGDQRIGRLTGAYRSEQSSRHALTGMTEFADKSGSTIRLVTFGVEPRRMYPSEVSGGDTMILREWQRQSRTALDQASARLGREGTETFLASGRSWEDALREVDWQDGEVLVVGSSSTNPIKAVFLGSSATKIVQASPVPIIVVP